MDTDNLKPGDYVANSKGTIFKVLPEDIDIIKSYPENYSKSNFSEYELQHGFNQLLKGRLFVITEDKEGKFKTYGL